MTIELIIILALVAFFSVAYGLFLVGGERRDKNGLVFEHKAYAKRRNRNHRQ